MPAGAKPPVPLGAVPPWLSPEGRAPMFPLGPVLLPTGVGMVLLRLASELLAITLPRQCLFRTALVARFQIERVFLDVLDNVFLLNLALEATEGALNGL